MVRAEFHTTQPDILMAVLSVFPFEGFQEFEESVHAYIENDAWDKYQSEIRAVVSGIVTYTETAFPPDVNWNAVWESSFQPVVIDDFCTIRASFHPPVKTCRYELIIDPKMAFGTGHHETTELMIRQMRNMDFADKCVLDLGCGTGILAILASKLGAHSLTAIDHDEEAYRSAVENASINAVDITCIHGGIDHLPANTYDIVLANINRNALIDLMPGISRVLKMHGLALMSGMLKEDKGSIDTAASRLHFSPMHHQSLNEWITILYTLELRPV